MSRSKAKAKAKKRLNQIMRERMRLKAHHKMLERLKQQSIASAKFSAAAKLRLQELDELRRERHNLDEGYYERHIFGRWP